MRLPMFCPTPWTWLQGELSIESAGPKFGLNARVILLALCPLRYWISGRPLLIWNSSVSCEGVCLGRLKIDPILNSIGVRLGLSTGVHAPVIPGHGEA